MDWNRTGETDWTEERLRGEFSKLPNGAGKNLQRALDWTVSNDKFFLSSLLTSNGKAAFGILGKYYWNQIFTIYANGDIHVSMTAYKYLNNHKDRDEMLLRLKSINLSEIESEAAKPKPKVTMLRSITALTDQEMQKLLDIFNHYCGDWEDLSEKFISWTPEILTKFFTDFPNGRGKTRKRMLDWAIANKRFDQNTSLYPAFGILANNNKRLFNFSAIGYIYVTVHKDYYPHGVPQRDKLVTRLKDIKLLRADFDPESRSNHWTIAPRLSSQLNDSEVHSLIDIFEEFCL